MQMPDRPLADGVLKFLRAPYMSDAEKNQRFGPPSDFPEHAPYPETAEHAQSARILKMWTEKGFVAEEQDVEGKWHATLTAKGRLHGPRALKQLFRHHARTVAIARS